MTNKTILYIALCAAALASGALFAEPGTGAGANAVGNANVNTPATPATPAKPATPATPATSGAPATPATPATSATPATPAAPAAATESKNKVAFDEVDANADGKISRDEAKGDLTLNARFMKLDKNRDGGLTPDEYKAAAAPSQAKPKS